MEAWGIGLAGALLILALAIPFVARIRHREQKPVAAYFIFITVFATAAAVLFGLLVMLADRFGMQTALDDPLVAAAFVLLVFIPAAVIAAWQARKPPWRRGPPD